TSSKTSSACPSASNPKIHSGLGNSMTLGSFLAASQSVLCHKSLVLSPVFCMLPTRSYRIFSCAISARGISPLPALLWHTAIVTPSSTACAAPWALVGRNGWALSPSSRLLPLGETQLG